MPDANGNIKGAFIKRVPWHEHAGHINDDQPDERALDTPLGAKQRVQTQQRIVRELDAESVQTCVTSPPYWGLRDYGTDGQLGLEPTPEEYVANLVAVFREVRRVLRGVRRAVGADHRAQADGWYAKVRGGQELGPQLAMLRGVAPPLPGRCSKPRPARRIGWRSTCDHDDDSGRPVILDPFAGAGTTGVVATRHDRDFIGVELNSSYCELARNRIRDDAPLLNANTELAA